MPKEIDKRNVNAFLRSEGNKKSINAWTGNTRSVKIKDNIHLSGGLTERAISFLGANNQSFGFENTPATQFVADSNIYETSTGQKTVHVQQLYKGVPVFLVNQVIIFNQDGGIEGTVGDSVNITEDISIEPTVTAVEAVEVAVQAILSDDDHAEGDVEHTNGWDEPEIPPAKPQGIFVGKKLVEFTNLAPRPTVLDASIFAEDIRANLVMFYVGPGAVLGWHITITVSTSGPQYNVVVSANDSCNIEVLYLKDVSDHVVARGKVHKMNGGDPKVVIDFPLPRTDYPLPSNGTVISFKEWVAKDETGGVNVIAKASDSSTSLKGISQGTTIMFEATTEKEQQLLNIFYFCNFMHDFFFLLGFDEKAGSFEGNDPLIATLHAGSLSDTANMYTPIDGSSPVMNLGAVPSSGRHTALDCDVVFHEYVHGVTKRLAGGKANTNALTEEQSKAMGEGWGDYFALTIQNFNNPVEKVTTGSWVKNKPSGVRSHPYSDAYANHRTYGKIASVPGVHGRGEVWCAALMHWTRHLSNDIGKSLAYYICWQSVVDGLKLINANPSFLEARDGILRALESLENKGVIKADVAAKSIKQLWDSFAKFGMGVKAQSAGPFVQGIKEDFTTP